MSNIQTKHQLKQYLKSAIKLKHSIKALKKYKNVKGLYYSDGLCSNTDISSALMEKYFKKWKHFSGNNIYPVTIKNKNPGSLYDNSLNKYLGKYGKKRIKLLNFIIKSIEKDLRRL